MSVVISGTGLFTPTEFITNEELVQSFNQFVVNYNEENKNQIDSGVIDALVPSSTEFIKKASGIEQRYVQDKEGILDICLLYTSPSPRDLSTSRMPSSA